MIGKRVLSIQDIVAPGDYSGPHRGYTGDVASVFFKLPNAIPGQRHGGPGCSTIHHVAIPPHKIRECADGSLEIRESIGAEPEWHGYLDEGHVWRGVGEWA